MLNFVDNQVPPSITRDPREDHLARELNHIFSLILGFAELAAAEQHIRGDTRLASYIEAIRDSGQRGSKLVKQWKIDN